MITGTNNPFPCSPVVFSAGNSIISLGTITRVGNVFTFSVGFVWKINGITYQNAAPIDLTITEASEGYFRIDNALLNTSNTIELQQGLPSETIALRPTYPETNILLTSWNISGDTIGDEEAITPGTDVVKKSFAKDFQFNGSGSNAVIPLNPEGYSDIKLVNSGLVSISGFDLSLMTGPNFETPYQGKQFIIWNQTGNDVTLKHDDTSNADYVFQLKEALDIIIPNNNYMSFYYDGALWQFDKNWSNSDEIIGLQSQLDLKENTNNKVTTMTGNNTSNVVFLTAKAIYDWAIGLFVPQSRTLTIGGVTQDLSANRTFPGGGSASLIRQQFTFSGSQTFTLASNHAQVYSVSVQSGGPMKNTQYTLVAPNQITILDTLDSGDYIVVIYSSSAVGIQPYYSQAETDGLLALKQNKFFSYKMTTPSSSVTGTTSETELVKITIPANTFSSSDIMRIPSILIPKIGINAAATIRIKMSTSATMPSGVTGQIAQITVNATSLYQQANGIFYINGGNLKGWPFTTARTTDISSSAAAMSSVAFDVTQTQYLYISAALLSALDSLRIEGLQIMNN